MLRDNSAPTLRSIDILTDRIVSDLAVLAKGKKEVRVEQRILSHLTETCCGLGMPSNGILTIICSNKKDNYDMPLSVGTRSFP